VVITVPSVVINHNAKTAIVYKQGRKFIYTIPIKSGKLTVTKLTEKQFENKGYVLMNTAIDQAVFKYLNHTGGHTDTAKAVLLGMAGIIDEPIND
jgi:hypothetical protein